MEFMSYSHNPHIFNTRSVNFHQRGLTLQNDEGETFIRKNAWDLRDMFP